MVNVLDREGICALTFAKLRLRFSVIVREKSYELVIEAVTSTEEFCCAKKKHKSPANYAHDCSCINEHYDTKKNAYPRIGSLATSPGEPHTSIPTSLGVATAPIVSAIATI